MRLIKRSTVSSLVVFLWLLPWVAEARPIIEVNCPGDTIQDKLNGAQPGHTLLVSGVCNENLVIREEVHRITLDGQGTAVINGGPRATTGPSTIRTEGRGITIKGFTITGGRDGINVNRGGTATLDGNFIQPTGRHGVLVNNNSHAEILNNTIQNNPQSGINVRGGSAVNIGFIGTPDARVDNPNVIQNNGGDGIAVGRSSITRIEGNTIEKNAGNGIRVEDNSGVILSDNATTVNNGGRGPRCLIGAYARGSLGTLNGNAGQTSFDATCINALSP